MPREPAEPHHHRFAPAAVGVLPGDQPVLGAVEGGEDSGDHGVELGAVPYARFVAGVARIFRQGRIAQHKPGAGLGLYLVQRIAELHGGQVTLDSAGNVGGFTSATIGG